MLARAARHGRHSGRLTANATPAFAPQWQCSGAQRRSFLTNRTVTSYVMKRAKILQIVWRTLAAYPEMHYITKPDAPINKLFARNSHTRERAFMFVLSLLPPDEPIDLPEFLRGAEDAAKLVLESVYDTDASRLAVLETLATPECVALWKQKREQVCKLLQVDEQTKLRLKSVQFKHVGASEVKYSFGEAKLGTKEDSEKKEELLEPPTAEAGEKSQEMKEMQPVEEPPRPHSKFLTHEAMQLKVKFELREFLAVDEDESDTSPPVIVDSTFEWAFDSDVSRAELVDWVVASASPFSSKLAKTDDSEEEIISAIEDAQD